MALAWAYEQRMSVADALFLRRRLGVQASQGPGHPGRLANPRLIRFPFISPILSFSLIWHRLASPYTHLGISKGADHLTSPCHLKNIGLMNRWCVLWAAQHILAHPLHQSP
jgi:hypothetical protein